MRPLLPLWILLAGFATTNSFALSGPPPPQRRREAPKPPPEPDEEESAEPEYTFNPIQAHKELQIGDFYFKKKSYRAAAGRYERATKWQPDLAEGYYKLGIAREKTGQNDQALAAFKKYLEVAATGNKADEVKKKIAQLEKQKPPSK